MIATVSRKCQFNSAHRLNNPAWDNETNKRVFGLCNNPNYHGHNYDLTVELTGEINPETGYVFDLGLLKKIITEEVMERFDHRNLNLDTPEFKTLNPTTENIAVIIWNILRSKIDTKFELKIKNLYFREEMKKKMILVIF